MVPGRLAGKNRYAAGTNERQPSLRVLFLAAMPAHDGFRHVVGGGKIGFDVDERRTIEAVEPDDREPGTVNAEQLDHTHSDRVRPGGRPQGKGAALDAALAGHLEPVAVGGGTKAK